MIPHAKAPAIEANSLHATTQNSPIRPGESPMVWVYGGMGIVLLVVIALARISANRRTPHDDDLDIGL